MKLQLNDIKLDSSLVSDIFNGPWLDEIGHIPLIEDKEVAIRYMMAKYNKGMSEKSLTYYIWWALQDFPYPPKEEIENGIKLHSKEVTSYKKSHPQNR